MIKEVVNDQLTSFLESPDKDKPVETLKHLMKITGEVIFRIFFGTKYAKNEDGVLLQEELKDIFTLIG